MDPSYILPCVYQFRVVVQGVSPLVWRRLLVRSDMSLATLHATLPNPRHGFLYIYAE
jgi:hypothetical protein